MPSLRLDLSGRVVLFALLLISLVMAVTDASAQSPTCSASNTILANVTALDQPFMLNRLGASMPQGMIFSLLQDVMPKQKGGTISAGNVMLRSDKRPRPMVLRMSVGQCMQVNFWNLLSPTADPSGLQPATRKAGVHAEGMQLYNAAPPLQPAAPPGNMIQYDGSYVGVNPTSLAAPLTGSVNPQTPQATYVFYADHDGAFLLYSTGAPFGNSPGTAGQLTAGLFGAVN